MSNDHHSNCGIYIDGGCDCREHEDAEESLQPHTYESHMGALVNRFLGWKLPSTFSPDAGISFTPYHPDQKPESALWPIGTNLLTASEAKQMLEHVLAAVPGQPPAPVAALVTHPTLTDPALMPYSLVPLMEGYGFEIEPLFTKAALIASAHAATDLLDALEEAEHYLKFNEPADAPYMKRIAAAIASATQEV